MVLLATLNTPNVTFIYVQWYLHSLKSFNVYEAHLYLTAMLRLGYYHKPHFLHEEPEVYRGQIASHDHTRRQGQSGIPIQIAGLWAGVLDHLAVFLQRVSNPHPILLTHIHNSWH